MNIEESGKVKKDFVELEQAEKAIADLRSSVTSLEERMDSVCEQWRDLQIKLERIEEDCVMEYYSILDQHGLRPGVDIEVGGKRWACIGCYGDGYVFRDSDGKTVRTPAARLVRSLNGIMVIINPKGSEG